MHTSKYKHNKRTSPVFAPGISDNPVDISSFGVGFPSNNAHDVVDHHVPNLCVIDASTRVLDDGFRVDTRRNRTTGVDFTLQLVNNIGAVGNVTVGTIFGNGSILKIKISQ